MQPQQQGPDLRTVLNVDELIPLLTDDEILQRLREHLPEGSSGDVMDVSEQLRSAQMTQVLDSLTAALSGPHAADVFASFGLSIPTAGVRGACSVQHCSFMFNDK